MKTFHTSRRDFLKTTFLAAAAVSVSTSLPKAARASSPSTSQVSVTGGYGRADNAFRAMQPFKSQIAQAIGTRRVILKPNVVNATIPLCATDVSWMEGILEFLKSIGKTNVVIAESTAGIGQNGTKYNTMYGFDNYGYLALANKYPVKFMDLNGEGTTPIQLWNLTSDSTPNTTIKASKVYFDKTNFVISCPRIKTHNCVVATASTKNIAMSVPHVDVGYFFSQPGSQEYKHGSEWDDVAPNYGMHGENANSDFQPLNDNIFRVAYVYGLHPDMAVIDGYQGMQGNGPTSGTAAPVQNLGICSLDFLAADRIAVRLMGHDNYVSNSGVNFTLTGSPNSGPYPACLNYLGQAGVGQWNINNIQLIYNGTASPMTALDNLIVAFTPNPTVLSGAQLGMRATPRSYDFT